MTSSQPAAIHPLEIGVGVRIAWWLLCLLATGVGAYAIALQDARQQQASFFAMRWLDHLHFAAGGVALVVAPHSFRRALLRRRPSVHRRLGWVYVLAVAVSGAAALLMATTSMHGLTTHLGFGILAALWLLTTGLGLRAVLQRRIPDHRRWFVRSFALCFAAVTLRVQLGPLVGCLDGDFPTAYRIVSWSCWVPNLLFAEWWLRRTGPDGNPLPRRAADHSGMRTQSAP